MSTAPLPTSTPTASIAGRFRALAATLIRNADLLGTAGLPEAVTATRVTVYRDVASQLRLLAAVDTDSAEGNPLVVTVPQEEAAAVVARGFELFAGQLATNARLLTTRTADAVMRARARVYRDVAAQARLWAEDARASLRPRLTTRLPLSTATAAPNPVAVKAATRAPRVRPAFLESLVDAIAKRRGQGWSVARLTLWLRTTLRDPQTDATHPCSERPFVAYVTRLLASAPSAQTA